MSDLTLRRATAHDVETLARYNESMASETEGKTLDSATIRAGVQSLIDDPDNGFYLMAERDGDVVGALMITTEWSDWRNGTFWWIQSVYVRPEARRQGVYSALHRTIRDAARADDDVCGIRLYVEKDNAVARATYEALGMSETPYRMYEEEL